MRNLFTGSLAGRLVLYALAILLPPFLAQGGVLFYEYRVAKPQAALDQALAQAEEGAEQLDDFMSRTGKVLLTLAHLPQVEGFQVEAVTPLLQELNQHYPEYEDFFLTDAQGQVVAAAYPDHLGLRVDDRPYFQKALATRQLAFSGLLTSRRSGQPTVVAAYPVVGRYGQALGIMAATVDLSRLPHLLSRVRLKEGYSLNVFDQEGRLVFQTGPPGVAPKPSQCTQCHAMPSPKGELPPRTWIGGDRFHGLTTTSLGWHVLVNGPSSTVLGGVQRQAWIVLAFAMVIVALSLWFAHFFGRRISQPLLRLAEASRRFGAGESVEPLPVTGRDEVAELTNCFNTMIGEVGEGRRRLEERQNQLTTILEIDRAMSSTLSLPAVLDILADKVCSLTAVDGAAIFLLEEGRLTLATSRGLASEVAARDGGKACMAMAQQVLQAKTYTMTEPPHGQSRGESQGRGNLCLAVPLTSRGRDLGAISFCSSRPDGFTAEEREFLTSIALQASIAVENARLYQQEERRVAELEALSEELRRHRDELLRAQEKILETLSLSLQAKDPYTMKHGERVSLLARRLARRLGLPREKQDILGRAALLHDIGKITIPDRLLNKKGRLTPPERAEFELHPERSAELLRHLPELGQVLPAIRGHHERYDGKGYPDGLAGEEIPLEARIIAVADGYDALTTDRPYRPAFSHEEALEILRANAATQWDPKVVQALLDSFQEEGEL
jgi:putative nucleotidyltransferase with HDIG domain